MPPTRHGSGEYDRSSGSGSFDGYKRLILDTLGRLEEQNTRIETGLVAIERKFAVHEKAFELRAAHVDGKLRDVAGDLERQGDVIAKELETHAKDIKDNRHAIANLRQALEAYIGADTRKQVAVAASASGALTAIIEVIKLAF